MAKLKLTIVTPEQLAFDGEVDRVMVRAALGEMAVLPGHIDCAAALGDGEARVTCDGGVRKARICGGMIHISQNVVRILTNDFCWTEDGAAE